MAILTSRDVTTCILSADTCMCSMYIPRMHICRVFTYSEHSPVGQVPIETRHWLALLQLPCSTWQLEIHMICEPLLAHAYKSCMHAAKKGPLIASRACREIASCCVASICPVAPDTASFRSSTVDSVVPHQRMQPEKTSYVAAGVACIGRVSFSLQYIS
jgi:hypothetical protein